MSSQLTSNAEALRLFFTEDVYLVEPPVSPAITSTIPLTTDAVSAPSKIVADEKTTPAIEAKKEFEFEYLGKNQKGILILVNDKANKVSTEQGTELLRKLVKAISLTNNDFALVNYAKYETAQYNDFVKFFNCKIVLAFGVYPQQLDLSDFSFHILHQHQDCKLIFTKNLHELESDASSKKVLWGSLQQLK